MHVPPQPLPHHLPQRQSVFVASRVSTRIASCLCANGTHSSPKQESQPVIPTASKPTRHQHSIDAALRGCRSAARLCGRHHLYNACTSSLYGIAACPGCPLRDKGASPSDSTSRTSPKPSPSAGPRNASPSQTATIRPLRFEHPIPPRISSSRGACLL